MFFQPAPLLRPRVLKRQYLGAALSTTSATTYNFGNFVAPADGLMVVEVLGTTGNSRTVSSVSIGGTAGTIHKKATTPTTILAAIASREVAKGNQNVTVALSGGNGSGQQVNVHVYFLTGYRSPTPAAADVVGVNSPGAALALTCERNSVGIWGAVYNWSHDFDFGWTGPTEDSDIGSNKGTSSASARYTGGGTHNTSVFWSPGVDGALIGAAWR